MSKIDDRIAYLGFKLGQAPDPVANYLNTKRTGNLLYVSGRKSDLTGAVGLDVTQDEAKKAAASTVLQLLAIVKEEVGNLDLIDEVIKLQGFIRSGPGFDQQPKVLDGATEVLIDIFGENGRHARTATGVSELPYGATIQLDMILKMKEGK